MALLISVDVLRKRVESFPICVDKRELNIAIEGQINIPEVTHHHACQQLTAVIYWEQGPKIPMCEFLSSGTIKVYLL